ncbi:hypothetical protein DSL64_03345 [Dyadobacter luteus]|uniref:Uncharacterized protein n=1 Tax=Dyadobacter luteus TaxID=2259619 RepID=A0A3D8YGK2_9BACT|nr:T9SS type A sorting domain-containing protein [Dyadobacter luteus]REA63496.1 hypothetical protein DSL64_03345 [Dyadobacter luteus]
MVRTSSIVFFLVSIFLLTDKISAQDKVEINGVLYNSGSTVTLPCDVGTLVVKGVRGGLYYDLWRNGDWNSLPSNWTISDDIPNYSPYYSIGTDLVSGGVLKIHMYSSMSGNIASPYVNIVRPVPGQILGESDVCSGSSKSFSLQNAIGSVSWSVGDGLSISGSSTGSSVNLTHGGVSRNTFVKATISTSNGCGYFEKTKKIIAGTPIIGGILYNGGEWPEEICNGQTVWLQANSHPDYASLYDMVNYSWSGVNSYLVSDLGKNASFSFSGVQGQTASITLSVSNSCGTSPGSATVFRTLSDCGGGVITMRVFPNPVNDYLIVESTRQIKRTEIYNSAGKLVKSIRESSKNLDKSNKQSVDVKTLPRGKYFIHVTTEDGVNKSQIALE